MLFHGHCVPKANSIFFRPPCLYLEDVDDADEEEEVLAAVVLGGDPAPHVAHRRGVVDLMEQVMSSQFKSYLHIFRDGLKS